MSIENHLQPQPLIGIALGGGGVRGMANLGVMKVLEQEGFAPTRLAGTSMGGIIATLYAKGTTLNEIETEILRLAKLNEVLKLVDWLPGGRGLVKGQSIYNYLIRILGEELTFEDLSIPTALTAVDIIHREEVQLDQGRVVDAVRASMAVPGVFAPVELNGRRLVDGGVLNNVPADVVRGLGADVVIAVDVGVGAAYDEREDSDVHGSPFPGFTPAFALDLWQMQSIMVDAITAYKLQEAKPDVLLRPQIHVDIGLFSGISKMKEVIAAGEIAARQALPEIKRAIFREWGRETI